MHRLFRISLILAAGAALARPAHAQRPEWDPRRAEISRESLQVLMERYEETSRSPVYTAKLRERSRREADLIRERLTNGDFNVGDRIALTVEADTSINDTLTVDVGRVVNLPGIGVVPLTGVLRSDLTAHLTAQMRRFVNNPVVRARSLVRISMLGEVNKPGFYSLPPEMLIDQALMAAQGPTSAAKLDQIRIERGSKTLWAADAVQQFIAEGRTLNSLGMRAGDRIVVPKQGQRNWEQFARTIGIAASLPFTVVGLIKLLGL